MAVESHIELFDYVQGDPIATGVEAVPPQPVVPVEPEKKKHRLADYAVAAHVARRVSAARKTEKEVEALRTFIQGEMASHRKMPTKKQCVEKMWDMGFPGLTQRSIKRILTAAGIDLNLEKLLHDRKLPHPAAMIAEDIVPLSDQTWIDWHPLQLFDRLMHIFNPPPDDEDPVEDRQTWIAWRVFIAAAFGLPKAWLARDWSVKSGDPRATLPAYPGVALEIPRGAAALPAGADPQAIFEACTGRTTWPTAQTSEVAMIVGRGGGKSYITAAIGIYLACCRRYRLSLGQRGMVMILAKDREQANVIRTYVKDFVQALPELRMLLQSEPTQSLIELTNGIRIEVRAVSDSTTRAYSVIAVLADEIAFWPTDEISARQDKRVIDALRPAMNRVKGSQGMIIMLSSPYAQRGELYRMHKEHYAQDDNPHELVWQADTLSMHPTDNEKMLRGIARMYRKDPATAKAEYGGLFRSDLENIFGQRAVEELCAPGCLERGYVLAHGPYRAFVDPSGGSADSMTMAIAHTQFLADGGQVEVLDLILECIPPFKPSEVVETFVTRLKSYGLAEVTGDAYALEWVGESFRKRGVFYQLSSLTKNELYLSFLPLVNNRGCELLDALSPLGERLVNQLTSLERRVGRTGKDTVDHPPGGHDDVANAVAGVLVRPGQILIDAGSLDIGVRREGSPADWRF